MVYQSIFSFEHFFSDLFTYQGTIYIFGVLNRMSPFILFLSFMQFVALFLDAVNADYRE